MKKLLILFFLLGSLTGWSQDTVQKPRKERLRFYYFAPGGIGDNVIAKANKGKIGLGFSATLVTFNQLHLHAGYEIGLVDITDISLAGNIESTIVSQIYVGASYKFPLTKNLEINPQLNVGGIQFAQTGDGKYFGRQLGPAITPGLTIDYRAYKSFCVFTGVNYCIAFPTTHTNSEYKSFFGNIQMVNIMLGIKF